MKQYLLSIYQPDGGAPPPDVLDPIMRDVRAWQRELDAAGSWVFSAGLHPPSTATVLRPKDGDVLLTDGPFVEGKEHIGGFTIIRAADLDAALEWGRRLSRATTLPIEVRPLQGTDGDQTGAGGGQPGAEGERPEVAGGAEGGQRGCRP